MNDQQVETIKQELMWRKTEELVEIWQLHKTEELTEDAFEAVRQILLSRLEELPYQDNQAEAERRLGLTQQYLDLDQPDRALEECDLAVRAAPHFAEAYNARGMVLDDLGRLDEAIASYEEALILDPDSAATVKNLAFATKERAEKERVEKDRFDGDRAEQERIEKERTEDARIQASKPSGYTSSLMFEAWTLVRRNKSIWVLAIGYVILTLRRYAYPTNVLALDCLLAPLDLVIYLLLTASIIQVIHNLIYRIGFHPIDIWKAALKSFFRLLVLLLLATVSLLPVLLVYAAAVFFSTSFPIFSYFLIGSGVLFLVVQNAAVQFLQIEIVLHKDPIHKCIARGIKVFLRNIVRISIQTVILNPAGFLLFLLAFVTVIPAFQISENPIFLEIHHLRDSLYFEIAEVALFLCSWSIGTSAYVLLHHRIMSAEQKGENGGPVIDYDF